MLKKNICEKALLISPWAAILLACTEGVEAYRERIESLDSFLTVPSSALGAGSRNRLRFSGTEAVALLWGKELEADWRAGWQGCMDREKQRERDSRDVLSTPGNTYDIYCYRKMSYSVGNFGYHIVTCGKYCHFPGFKSRNKVKWYTFLKL